MSPGEQRRLQRLAHLCAAVLLAVYVYVPLSDRITAAVRFVALPVLTVTGVAMWQAARIRKALRHARKPTYASPE